MSNGTTRKNRFKHLKMIEQVYEKCTEVGEIISEDLVQKYGINVQENER